MRNQTIPRIFAILAVAMSLTALPAAAQATRTWVSGVGDDANPCSRTAPCKTFAGAISKTAPSGEINVLDPGGFGAVTITKSITISSESFEAGVLVSGTNAIVVNAPANAVVILRGLDIEGLGTGLNGINFLGGGSLHVEKCSINNFVQQGISFKPATAGTSRLYVSNTVIRNNANATNGGGIHVKPGVGVNVVGAIDNVRLEANKFGIRVEDRAKVAVRDSIATANSTAGFICASASTDAIMTLERSTSSMNGRGVRTEGSALSRLRITDCAITDNSIQGIDPAAGNITSWGNNYVDGNAVEGVPNDPVTPE
jgi:hypothetical protein